MNKKPGKQQKGFTIIEVLIVLAIAGLIMLIVFLAVPALQRNSRNTQRRSDASRIAAATVEAANNANWQFAGFGVLMVASQALENMNDLSIYQNKDLTNGNLRAALLSTGSPTQAPNADINIATVVLDGACSGETSAVFKKRSVAVLYMVETGGDPQPQCESA